MLKAAAVPEPTPRLAVRGLRRSLGGREVLRGVDLSLPPGGLVALLGPNGAGKSTLFSLLVGLLRWEAGELLLDGRPCQPTDPAWRARVGIVFQQPSLDRLLTARENLLLAAAVHGIPRSVAAPRAESLLALVDLADRSHDRVGTFSGGMKRRLEIARSLLHEPEILLLDEPTTGLDEGAVRDLWAHLAALRRERGLSILLTSHRLDDAERCDDVVLLDQGLVVTTGSPAALKARLGGQVLSLRPAPSLSCDDLAAAVRERFGLAAQVADGCVVASTQDAHRLVPRVAEAFPGQLLAMSVSEPTLGDVFVALTGRGFDRARAAS